jgi:hypothetical protein
VRIPLALYLVALVVRIVVAAGFPDPAYVDSSYYVQVARELAAGHGFVVDFIWIFPEVGGAIPANPVLPIISNAHWLPLASLIQVPFIWLLGPTMAASLIPMCLMGALMAPIAWCIARDAGLRPAVGIGAGLLAAAPILSTAYMSQPENFSVFGPIAAGALLLAGRGLRGETRWFIAAALVAGLAGWVRTEGLLLIGAVLLAWLWRRLRGGTTVSFGVALASGIAYLAVIAPWYARQLAVFGSLSPSTATGKVLYLRSFSEWNSITTPASLEYLLGMGIGPLLMTRVDGLVAAIGLFSVLVMGVVLVPFLVVGTWKRRGQVEFLPALLFALALFAFAALVTAIHVPGGQFMHSAVALIPHAYVLALEGAVIVAAWLALRLRSKCPERLTTTLVGGLVAIGLVSAVFSVVTVQRSWREASARLDAAGQAHDQLDAPATDRVMSTDAASSRYWTGRGGVVLVNDPVATTEAIARAYDIRWLILDDRDSVPLAQAVHDGQRPAWVGPAVWDGDGVAVYPVCTEPGDERCQGPAS